MLHLDDTNTRSTRDAARVRAGTWRAVLIDTYQLIARIVNFAQRITCGIALLYNRNSRTMPKSSSAHTSRPRKPVLSRFMWLATLFALVAGLYMYLNSRIVSVKGGRS